MAPGNFKVLIRRTVGGKVLRNKTFNIAKNWKYNGSQRELISMAHNFFDKKSFRAFSNYMVRIGECTHTYNVNIHIWNETVT